MTDTKPQEDIELAFRVIHHQGLQYGVAHGLEFTPNILCSSSRPISSFGTLPTLHITETTSKPFRANIPETAVASFANPPQKTGPASCTPSSSRTRRSPVSLA